MGNAGGQWQFQFEAIGTQWTIDIYDRPDALDENTVLGKIQQRIDEFDAVYSRFRKDSLVAEMARKSDSYSLPADAKALLDAYQKFYDITDGAVTPLIGQTMEQAGYGADYSLTPQKLTSPPAWGEVLRYEYPTLELKQPALLDFGAAGKGYLVDLVGKLLESLGISSFCVDAGGDILHKNAGGKTGGALEIGLENPADTSQAIGIATIQNQSLCASAGNRRKWAGMNHIIDPASGTSPENILATWVVAKTALVADGLATCLYFVPGQKLRSHFMFEYLILYKDSSVEQSELFPAELFYQ